MTKSFYVLTRRTLWFSCLILLSGMSLSHAPMTFAGAGPPPAGTSILNGIAVDAQGNLFIADSGLGLIRRIPADRSTMTIAAGIGMRGFSGDGGRATSAQITIVDIAVDDAGNLFIAGPDVVRKVSPAGVISTVAGIPERPGLSGDGGPATRAQITAVAIAVDADGNLFIGGDPLKAGSAVIRKVTAAGVISTVAGTGTPGFNVESGPATSVQLGATTDLAVDRSGNLLIADRANHRVWRLTAIGTISTLAGVGTSQLGPARGAIRNLGPNGYNGDGGQASAAWLNSPSGLAVDATGNVLIADSLNRRIRKVTPNGVIATVAGNGTEAASGDGGPATAAGIAFPQKIAMDATGNLYIMSGRTIRKVSPDGIISSVNIPTSIAAIRSNRQIAAAARDATGNLIPWTAIAALVALTLGVARSERKKKP